MVSIAIKKLIELISYGEMIYNLWKNPNNYVEKGMSKIVNVKVRIRYEGIEVGNDRTIGTVT